MAGAEIARGEPAAENGADRCGTNARYCTAFSPVWAKFYTLSPQTSGKSRYGTLRIGGPALDCITTPAPETRVDYGLSTTKGSGERSRLLCLSLTVVQSPFTTLSCLGVSKRDVLVARVIIHAYNQHVRLLSPEPMVLDKPQSTRVSGAGVVMQSSVVLEIHMYGSHEALCIASE